MPDIPASATRLDPRRNAYREDLAAESLRGKVEAPRYAVGTLAQVVRPAAPVCRKPLAGQSLETEALFGELVTVYDQAEGWAWGQLDRDGYVGYLPADALAPAIHVPTHKVRALGTFLYPAPDIKSPPLLHVPMGAPLAVAEMSDKFARLAGGGYLVTRHVGEIGRNAKDFVEVAERFIGTPYLWGGRTRIGLDCSGLAQLALEAAGIRAPRDSDMQQAELGTDVLVPQSLDGLIRGDLVFWPGHVGIMTDGVMLLHANAYHMAVVVEPLARAVERTARSGSTIAKIKRLSALCA